jgi:hypothetical protein
LVRVSSPKPSSGGCDGRHRGGNDVNARVYDFDTGGCFDGLQATGVNENQGAESTLSWLISLLTLYEVVG